MSTAFANPDAAERRALLKKVHTIAVLGLSPKPERPSHRVALQLQSFGYKIIPVRPGINTLLGERVYADIMDVAEPIDLVNVFRRSEYLPSIVQACLARGVPALWAQLGILHAQAAARAREGGMMVVMDRCIAVDYRELMAAQ